MGLGGVLEVRSLHDCIHGAGLLAVTAVDALGHVDVVPGRPPGPVLPLLSLDGDGLGGAYSLAELASDAPLLAGGVPPQSVLAAKPGAQARLLERVVELRQGFGGLSCVWGGRGASVSEYNKGGVREGRTDDSP